MGWNRFTIGCKCCGGDPNAPCRTHSIRVLDTLGNPVPGLYATIVRQTAGLPVTTTTFNGYTDSNGVFSITLTNTATQSVTSVRVTFPRGGPDVFHVPTQSVKDPATSTCTYNYVFCTRVHTVSFVDGDTGLLLSGARVGGDPDGFDCVTPPFVPYIDTTPTAWTQYAYEMQVISATGAVLGVSAYGQSSSNGLGGPAFGMGGFSGCLPGYWSDAGPIVLTPCDTSSFSYIKFWSKDKYLRAWSGTAYNDRRTVMLKKMCVRLVAPTEVTGALQYTLDWDTTSWDGRLSNFQPGMGPVGEPQMRFRLCAPPGNAKGSCQRQDGGVYLPAEDRAYGSVSLAATFIDKTTGGGAGPGKYFNFEARPDWNSTCTGGSIPDCTGPDVVYSGPHVDCQIPRLKPDGTPGGVTYAEVKPSSLNANISPSAGTVPGDGGYDSTYALTGAGGAAYSWGCGTPKTDATVRVSDGECLGGTDPYDTTGGPDQSETMYVLGDADGDPMVDGDGNFFSDD